MMINSIITVLVSIIVLLLLDHSIAFTVILLVPVIFNISIQIRQSFLPIPSLSLSLSLSGDEHISENGEDAFLSALRI